jgi:hypothetical protein
MGIKPQEPRLQSDRFSSVNRINVHQDMVNPLLSISIVKQFAHPPQVRIIVCTLIHPIEE